MKLNLTLYRNDLIPVYATDKGNKVVDARELHKFLGIDDKFSMWVKRKIKAHNFIENKDFTTYSQKTEKGRPTKEYIFLLDPSKKIAMGTNNTQGDMVKDYFLACERVAIAATFPKVYAPSLEDHTKREIQVENSKATGAIVFREEGIEGTKEYYKKTCAMCSGMQTHEVKKIAKARGLKSKDRCSARAALRIINPPAAATISFVDTAYRSGLPLSKLQAIADKAKDLFSDMLKLGIVPGELTA